MSEPAAEPVEPAEEPAEAPEPDEPGPSDDEAAEAEEAEAADEEATEPEPENAAPSDIAPESPADKKRLQQAQRAVTSYARKIAELFPESADELLGCPLCGETQWPGFVHAQDAGHVPQGVIDATQLFLGFAREQDYPQDPTHRPCETCGALGKVSTGSRVAGKDKLDCPTCRGYGYTPPPGAPGNGVAPEGAVLTGPLHSGEPLDTSDRDAWGDPKILPDGRENPNYGRMPQYKVPVDPYGVTAGLTAQDAPV